jgi:hypothetical protein
MPELDGCQVVGPGTREEVRPRDVSAFLWLGVKEKNTKTGRVGEGRYECAPSGSAF